MERRNVPTKEPRWVLWIALLGGGLFFALSISWGFANGRSLVVHQRLDRAMEDLGPGWVAISSERNASVGIRSAAVRWKYRISPTDWQNLERAHRALFVDRGWTELRPPESTHRVTFGKGTITAVVQPLERSGERTSTYGIEMTSPW
jgi:hypothetical protein